MNRVRNSCSLSKIKGESMFSKQSKPGWALVITWPNRMPRYVNRLNEEGHKTFRYNTLSQLRSRHIRPTFWLDSEFDNALFVMESMILNGYPVTLHRIFEGDLKQFDRKEVKK